MIAVFRYTLGQDRLQVVPRFPPQNHLLLQPYQNAALSFSRCTCNCGYRQRAYVTEVGNSDLEETTRTVKELARHSLQSALSHFLKSSKAESQMTAAASGMK